MERLIWDLPTRLFHWLLAVSVVLALVLAEFAEKETPLFYLHVVFGVLAGLLIIWRLIWGFIGSEHAQWRKLFFTPASILNYFKEVIRGRGEYHAGHNPGSSVVILGMLLMVALVVLSGIMITQSELFEELHESLPYVLLALIGVHLAGVLIATKMHKVNYPLSMITGYKRAAESERIASQHGFSAVVMLVFVLGLWGYFIKGFDRNSALFSAPGTNFKFQIGEPEAEAEGNESGIDGQTAGDQNEKSRRDYDDDDGDED